MNFGSILGGGILGTVAGIASAPFLGPTAGPILGGLFGTAKDVWSAGRASDEASFNRDWQAQMSGTAHQREVADLRAAGLNPILSSGGGGASTPSGAVGDVPQISNPAATVADLRLKSASHDAAVGAAMASSAQASKTSTEQVGASLNNHVLEQSIPYMIRKAKAEATSAEGLSRADKALGDLYDRIGSGGKGVKEFLPMFMEIFRSRR
nr:MAG: DNA pilot protein [Microvirus sp.]